MLVLKGQRHRQQPAPRRAEDGHLVQPQVIYQRQRIGGLLHDRIGHHILGEIRRPAPATVQPDDARAVSERLQHRLEIVHVAGKARQAQQRHARALIVIGQRQPVRGREIPHENRPSNPATPVRSEAILSGGSGRRSTGSPARLTQSERNP